MRRYKTTVFTKTNEVKFWDVYTQTWKRQHATDITAKTLATMNDVERRRIAAAAAAAEDE